MKANDKDTKQQIIDAAFGLIAENPLEQLSLSAVAERVGISKPAIFRHFLNKDALIEAIKVDCFYKMAQAFGSVIDSGHDFYSPQVIDHIVRFFLQNEKYLFFLIQLIVHANDAEKMLEREMHTAGISIPYKKNFTLDAEGNAVLDKPAYYRSTYAGLTVFYFMVLYTVVRGKRGQPVCPAEEFGGKIRALLHDGIEGFAPLSDERLRALHRQFTFAPQEETVRGKIFVALCKVIAECGIPRVTVGAVAQAADMAKSSLYNYFSSKDDMIKSLVSDEFVFLTKTIEQNCKLGQTNTEILAAYMYSIMLYFKHKPYSVGLFSWLRMNDFKSYINVLQSYNEAKRLFDAITMPDMGIPIVPPDLLDWISSMPVTLVLHERQYNLTEEDIFDGIKAMLGFITNGGKNV